MLTLLATVAIAPLNVLVFSKTAGFRHDSIPAGHTMFAELARENKWNVVSSEDASLFTPYNLSKYDAVVFLNTTGDILNPGQQTAFERYMNAGGGFIGIHSAADTEYEWPYYGATVGGYFQSHPEIQEALIKNEYPSHATMKMWPGTFARKDEWYDFRANPRPNVKVLASLDPKSYKNHKMPDDHPIVWCQEVSRGRSWYTGFGHTKETYSEPSFRKMITAAVHWVAKKQ